MHDQDNKEKIAEAHALFISSRRQINSIIAGIIGFNSCYDWEDYMSQAFIACYEAVIKFNPCHLDDPGFRLYTEHQHIDITAGTIQMKKQTYSYWIIEKMLHKMADLDEVEYIIFNKKGQHVDTMSNVTYRKHKKAMKEKGYRAESTRIAYSFSDKQTIRDGKVTEFDPADNSEYMATMVA